MAESRAAYMREYRKKKKEVTQKERAETVATEGPAEGRSREKVTQRERLTVEFLAALGLGISGYLRQRGLYEEAADLAEAARNLTGRDK